MTVVVYLGDPDETRDWVALLARLLPEHEVRDMDDPGDPDAVRYAVVWAPPPGRLARFPALRAIVSVGAGIDHVLRDSDLPKEVPILRTTDAQQSAGTWRQVFTPPAQRRRVGMMGLGRIGAECARTLVALGFDVAGWSRSRRTVEGVRTFAGRDELGAFLGRTEILVSLLPLTPETRGILDADLLDALPRGASLINAGRGGHLVEADLLAALASGQISQATLDVFNEEPLPPGHPFWQHDRIRVTPHIASWIDPETGAGVIARNIRAFEATGSSDEMADAQRGY